MSSTLKLASFIVTLNCVVKELLSQSFCNVYSIVWVPKSDAERSISPVLGSIDKSRLLVIPSTVENTPPVRPSIVGNGSVSSDEYVSELYDTSVSVAKQTSPTV